MGGWKTGFFSGRGGVDKCRLLSVGNISSWALNHQHAISSPISLCQIQKYLRDVYKTYF